MVLLAALAVASTGHVGASEQSPADLPSASAGTAAAGAGSFAWYSYEGPEGARRYKLYIPDKTKGKRRLIVMLHGCTQDPDDLARGTRMNEVARERGVLVLYPEQPATANPLKCWNWFTAANQVRGAGEPALLAAMIRKVIADQAINPSGVFIAGLSAGGAMTAILGATYPEMFSAIAVHSAIAYGLATDMSQALVAMRSPKADGAALGHAVVAAMGERRKILPVFIAQGSIDMSVNVAHAGLLVEQWLVANGHAGAPPIVGHVASTGGYSSDRSTYRAVNGRPLIEVWMVNGLAHAWSGGSKDGTYTDEKGPDISHAIVDFFAASGKRYR